MSREIATTLTNMCMIYDDQGRVLVQDKVSNDWWGITFPGGHVRPEESIVDSTIREIKEETGLDITDLEICGIKDWTNEDGSRYVVFLYKTNKFSGQLQSSDEGEVYWVDLEELKHLKLASSMDIMLEVFLRNDVSEHFFFQENGEWKDQLK